MDYQLLGRSGLRVSDICLGTMTFGEDWGWGSSKDVAAAIYKAYRDAGGNFLDTANLYTQGSSERFVGEFIDGHRGEIVVATKYTNAAPGTDANAGGNQRKNMIQAVEASLKRLNTDYIDLYWLHAWDQKTPAEEVMRAFDDLVRSGKVLYVGVSDAPAWVIAKSNTLAALRGWTPYVGMQIEYSLLERSVERELIPLAKDEHMTVLAWSPLRSGMLTGKYLPELRKKSESTSRLNHDMMKNFIASDARADDIVREVVAVATELKATPSQVALAWLRYRAVPVIPIVGARTLEQFNNNMLSLEVKLESEQLARLDKISAIKMGFPGELFENPLARTFASGGLWNRIRAPYG